MVNKVNKVNMVNKVKGQMSKAVKADAASQRFNNLTHTQRKPVPNHLGHWTVEIVPTEEGTTN